MYKLKNNYVEYKYIRTWWWSIWLKHYTEYKFIIIKYYGAISANIFLFTILIMFVMVIYRYNVP
jgi:hypothetical protein